MIPLTITVKLSELKPIRCGRRLKGTWQSMDGLANNCDPLAIGASGDIVFDWNGGGGTGHYELMGKNFAETDIRVIIDDRPFDAKAWVLNGRGIMFSCMDCGTKKKFAGVRYLVNSTHNMGRDELSRFLIDKMNFKS